MDYFKILEEDGLDKVDEVKKDVDLPENIMEMSLNNFIDYLILG